MQINLSAYALYIFPCSRQKFEFKNSFKEEIEKGIKTKGSGQEENHGFNKSGKERKGNVKIVSP